MILLPVLKLDAMTSAGAGSEVREDEKHLSLLHATEQCVQYSCTPMLWGASCRLARTRAGAGLAEFRGKSPFGHNETSTRPARGMQQRHTAAEEELSKPPSTPLSGTSQDFYSKASYLLHITEIGKG